jgi:membrane protein implicated in regulation of membrane protease activity
MGEIIFWAVAFVILTVVELSTYQLVSIWFALSSLLSLLCAVLGFGIEVQVIVFLLASTILLIATRPFIRKFLKNRNVPTNVELDIGKVAVVIEEINNGISGRVRLNGVDWAARSTDNSVINVGENVTVEQIDGAKLIVKNK